MNQHASTAASIILGVIVLILLALTALSAKQYNNQPSFQARILNRILRIRNYSRGFADTVCNAKPSMTEPNAGAPPREFYTEYNIRKYLFNGFPVYELSPKTDKEPTHQVLYMFGGAYVLPIEPRQYQTIVKNFLDNCGYSVIVPIYGRAPAYTYRDLIPLMEHAYVKMAQEQPKRPIILCGDSCGGNAVMMLSNRIPKLIEHTPSLMRPICSILVSPWADPSGSNPDAWSLRKDDPFLHGDAGRQAIAWFSNGEELLSTPLCPLIDHPQPFRNYDYPIILITSTYEMLNADAHVIRREAIKQGIKCYFLEYKGMVHDFPTLPFLPESAEVLTTVNQILKHSVIPRNIL